VAIGLRPGSRSTQPVFPSDVVNEAVFESCTSGKFTVMAALKSIFRGRLFVVLSADLPGSSVAAAVPVLGCFVSG
jgi:hypothetical protein